MPNCFQLIDRTTGEAASFNKVDDAMRISFGAEPDEKRFFRSWYDTIGLAIALGFTFEAIKEKELGDPEVADWLAARYTPSSWAER